MEDETKKKIYAEALKQWGTSQQLNMVTEELGELLVALNKTRRDSDDDAKFKERIEQMAGEIADVEIMLEQLKFIFMCSGRVESVKHTKLERLAERLKIAIPGGIVYEKKCTTAKELWDDFHFIDRFQPEKVIRAIHFVKEFPTPKVNFSVLEDHLKRYSELRAFHGKQSNEKVFSRSEMEGFKKSYVSKVLSPGQKVIIKIPNSDLLNNLIGIIEEVRILKYASYSISVVLHGKQKSVWVSSDQIEIIN